MPRNDLGFVNQFLDEMADRFLERVMARVNLKDLAGKSGNGVRGRRGLAKKAAPAFQRNMICRVAGCKNRSGGPRWGYICEEHRKKLSKAEQAAAREAWNKKHEAIKPA